MKHAEIRVGDFSIPLIGIPETAVLEECDCCHDEFPLDGVELCYKWFLCRMCGARNLASFASPASPKGDK